MNGVADSPLALAALCIVALVLIVALLLGRRLDLRIGNIHAELKPNGGSSLRDAVDRIEKRVKKLEDAAPPPVAVVVNNPPPPPERHVRSTD